MPATRSISDLFESKFEEFKNSLLVELKKEIDSYFMEEKAKFVRFVAEKQDEIAKLELVRSIETIQQHFIKLNDENAAMKEANNILKHEVDDIQQYVRRQNVRIYGVKVAKKETSADVEIIIKGILNDAEIQLPRVCN